MRAEEHVPFDELEAFTHPRRQRQEPGHCESVVQAVNGVNSRTGIVIMKHVHDGCSARFVQMHEDMMIRFSDHLLRNKVVLFLTPTVTYLRTGGMQAGRSSKPVIPAGRTAFSAV